MPITVFCSECGTKYRLEDRHAGKRFACRKCGSAIQAPDAPSGGESVPAKPHLPGANPQPQKPATPSRPTSPQPPVGNAGPPAKAPSTGSTSSLGSSFPIFCPGCGNGIQGTAALVGKKVRCKLCSQVFLVEAPRSASRRSATPPRQVPQPSPIDVPAGGLETDLFAGLSDGGLSSPLTPAAPRPMAQGRFAGWPKPLQAILSEPWENIWIILGCAYAVLTFFGLAIDFLFDKPADFWMYALVYGLLAPNLVCTCIGLFRMGRYGHWAYAVLCLVLVPCCCIGEVVALALSLANSAKWRSERLVWVWLGFFISSVVGFIAFSIALQIAPAFADIRESIRKARERSQEQQTQKMAEPGGDTATKESPKQPTTNTPGWNTPPKAPPTPAQPASPSPGASPTQTTSAHEQIVEALRQVIDREQQLLQLLRGVTDASSAENAAAQIKSVTAEITSLRARIPRIMRLTTEQAAKVREYEAQEGRLQAEIGRELQRIVRLRPATQPNTPRRRRGAGQP